MKKKLLSIFLVLALCLTLMPASAFGESEFYNDASVVRYDDVDQLIEAINEPTAREVIVKSPITLYDGTVIDGKGKIIRVEFPYLKNDGTVDVRSADQLLIVPEGANVTIKNAILIGGNDGDKGAIESFGNLTLENVSFTQSKRGLLQSGGTAVLKDCNFYLNSDESAGAMWCGNGATAVLDGCSFINNFTTGTGGGGALGVSGGSTKVYANNCVFSGNTTNEIGGAINLYYGNAYLMNCTITGNMTTGSNSYGGGVGNNGGRLYAVNTIFTDNYANASGTMTSSDIGVYSGNANYLYNCIYGAANNTVYEVNCKQRTESNVFGSYISQGIRLPNGNTSAVFTHGKTYMGKVTHDFFIPIQEGGLASTGGTNTYFDYSNISVVKMAYGSGEGLMQLDNVALASENDLVDTYKEGGNREPAVIGACGLDTYAETGTGTAEDPYVVYTWAQLSNRFSSGGHIKLGSDITASPKDTTLYSSETQITLDLNGHIIRFNGSEVALKVWKDVTLTINDSNPNRTHNPQVTYTDPVTNQEVEVKGGIITGGYARYNGLTGDSYEKGGGLYILRNSKLVMNGGSVTGNRACTNAYAAGITLDNSTFEMHGGSICGNAGRGVTGAVRLGSYSTMSMDGGKITGNVSSGRDIPAGVYGSATMAGGEITNNVAEQGVGGALGLTISGNPVVQNNFSGSSLYNVNCTEGVITVNGQLTEGCSVGVTAAPTVGNPKVVTSGYSTYNEGIDATRFFTSDVDKTKPVMKDDGEVYIVKAASVKIYPGNYSDVVSGDAFQLEVYGEIEPIVIQAYNGYYFPDDYTKTLYGLKLTRDSYSQITITGTPTRDINAGLTEATYKYSENMPTGTFVANGYDSGTLSGIDDTVSYSLDGGNTWTKAAGSEVALTGVDTVNGIKLKRFTDDPDTKRDSDEFSVELSRLAAPTTVTKTDCTTLAQNDGKLIGVTSEMEYKAEGDSDWISGTGEDITVDAGTYLVRMKAFGNSLASQYIELRVLEYVQPVTEAPVLPEGGEFTGPKTIEITCPIFGATIYYTTDGTIPTKASNQYLGPITIKGAVTIKAMAVIDGMQESQVVSADYLALPAAPQSATAVLTTKFSKTSGYNDIKVSWSNVVGAAGYKVYYKNASASTYTFLGDFAGNVAYKKDLANGTKYTVKVVPYFRDDQGNKYNSKSFKTATVYTLKKLSRPTVTKSGTKVKVKWNNINGETGYQISKSLKKTGTTVVATYPTTKGTYKLIKATKGKTYYYKVRAYKTVGGVKIYGPWSAVKAFKR